MSIEPYITARFSEHLSAENIGLGNVLFQTMAIYGIAKKHNLNYAFNTVVHYCNIIKSKFGIDMTRSVLRNFQKQINYTNKTMVIPSLCTSSYDYETRLIQVLVNNPTIHFIVHSYLENVDYFDEFYEEIKSLISPTAWCLHSLQECIPKLYDSSVVPVSVHFRYLWNSLDDTYYARAVQYVKDRVKNPHFFLFCDSGFAFNLTEIGIQDHEYTQVKLTPENIDLELYAIGHCSHHIVSQSTFCFWGVYLNRNPTKMVIKSSAMPMKWYGETCISL